MNKKILYWSFVFFVILILQSCNSNKSNKNVIDSKVDSLLRLMSLDEKLGQLNQVSGASPEIEQQIREGKVGSVLNVAEAAVLNKIQKIALEESPHGIPILVGRDVIHGFKTIFPIPLGMAATWDPELIRLASAVSAKEAASVGIHWTFAPMLDVSRDARWGRIAESFGEDPYLCAVMGEASIKGFQGDNLSDKQSIAACAKHYIAYGAAEGGRDYNAVEMSLQNLYNVYLPPFNKAIDTKAASFMVSFNEINGVPASGNEFLVRELLKDQLGFGGMVVSDWASIEEMINHGYASDKKQAAELAMKAGVDMEMVTTCYAENLKSLLEEGIIRESLIDDAVRRILKLKMELGLFERPYVDETVNFSTLDSSHLQLAKKVAEQSIVLLKNEHNTLPLNSSVRRLAIIGPLADDGYEQLGTWVFDGEERHSVTPLKALTDFMGEGRIAYKKVLQFSRDKDLSDINAAISIARDAEVVIIFGGEESILSGEAHCRADLTLPGAQTELIKALKKAGKPVVLVIMAGRPLVLKDIEPYCDAILFAWHPGTMAGPAITDIIFGKVNPSGKLPVSFPQMSGQAPIYSAHKSTGRPANNGLFVSIDSIPVRAFQTSLGNTSHYIDAGFMPAYSFGFGLSYTTFSYSNLQLNKSLISTADTLEISVDITNSGLYDGEEIVQLYVRDKVGSITRPVKELKSFKRISLQKGESSTIQFKLSANDLAFYGKDMVFKPEPGEFTVFVGGNSVECLEENFRLEK